jgi:hypothetical protein
VKRPTKHFPRQEPWEQHKTKNQNEVMTTTEKQKLAEIVDTVLDGVANSDGRVTPGGAVRTAVEAAFLSGRNAKRIEKIHQIPMTSSVKRRLTLITSFCLDDIADGSKTAAQALRGAVVMAYDAGRNYDRREPLPPEEAMPPLRKSAMASAIAEKVRRAKAGDDEPIPATATEVLRDLEFGLTKLFMDARKKIRSVR